ncbi:MAG: hypothetical protein AAGI17_02480 [Planctomycetota bacterium]
MDGFLNPESVIENAEDARRAPYHMRPYEPEPLREFEMHWSELVWPYDAHVVLMHRFLERYRDWKALYKEDADEFYRRAITAEDGLLEFLHRVKPRDPAEVRRQTDSLVTISERIRADGFNPSKRVVIARNPAGRFVMLKGAKRIATCVSLGVELVPVAEHRAIPERFAEPKRALFTRDYTSIIRRELMDVADVRTTLASYDAIGRALEERAA